MLKDYRAYLFDRDGNVFAIETFRATDDAFALLKSKQISSGGGFELWRCGDWIARIDAEGQAWEAPSCTPSESELNGLYKVLVTGGELQTTATVSLVDGVIRGGQETYAITGRYRRNGDALSGVVLGRRHSPQHHGYVFPYDVLRLQLEGWVFADHISGAAAAAELDVRFDIHMARLGN